MNPPALAAVESGTDTGREIADLAVARRVLALAIEGMEAISDSLDGGFLAALDVIEGLEGRVVVTGMGKSGHVARKIAATLASTGTPALFVHPGEASHGDLGMITRQDAVLALSNSGETAELSDIVAYTRRFRIPLLAMTRGGAASTLGETADILLAVPAVAEACPNGLAPTTSTTMMLAYGDALAVALLERRGFSAQDFKVYHPGGSLGRKLKRVADLMQGGEGLPLTTADVPMAEAIITMTAKHRGCVGVVDAAGALIGIVTDGDLRRHMGADLLNKPVSEVMTANPVTIRPSALAAEALGVMNERKVTVLFAVEDGKPVGVVNMHACLRAEAA